MSPFKRKQPYDAAAESALSEQQSAARRVTRQNSKAPLPYPADPERRRRRRRRRRRSSAGSAGSRDRPQTLNQDGEEEEGPVLTRAVNFRDPAMSASQERRPVHFLRKIRRHHDEDADVDQAVAKAPAKASRVEPSAAGRSPPSSRNPQNGPSAPHSANRHPTASSMTKSTCRTVRTLDHISANTSKPFVPCTNNSLRPRPKPTRKQQPVHEQHQQHQPTSADRNIDKVVLGNICFSTWYHSPYGTEALGEISGNSAAQGETNLAVSNDGTTKEEAFANASSRKAKQDKLDRLYVCPCCFKYSKELVPWWQHVHQCERRGYVPGVKIYTHPKARRTQQVTAGGAVAFTGPEGETKAVDPIAQAGEDTTEVKGDWSIWEVDGETESLFCQNLSLFAKLFLDNKSVFFDVAGFKYFLLVYTKAPAPAPALPDGKVDGGLGQWPPPAKHHIIGFFSKEKLSWDNNNLACILVFPPWQRKGLGALLMGVSYEISRREGQLGGPEKPISDLGKRGYKRFWAGEIAAWILGLNTGGDDEVVVDVEEISTATWIVAEDCLLILREMGVVEKAGLGPPPKRKTQEVSTAEEEDGGVGGDAQDPVVNYENEEEVPRVRVAKDAVWNWVKMNRISLEKACVAYGFVDGYGYATKTKVVVTKPQVVEDEM